MMMMNGLNDTDDDVMMMMNESNGTDDGIMIMVSIYNRAQTNVNF